MTSAAIPAKPASMHYISTRGAAPRLDFRGALSAGLASDGGLYVPESLPELSPRDLSAMATLSYSELALEIMSPFVGDSFSRIELKRMIDAAYANFRHTAVAPLTQLSRNHFVLELFHGPTLAFKDFALQLVGQMLEATLSDTGKRAVVLGATSGDTGSAAIAGCRGRRNMDILILYPEGRTSDVQRRQMTTVTDANVHALSVAGTFDDCQDIVKSLFTDQDFRLSRRLLAVNSINFARVLAQVVYYFYAALSLGAPARRVSFSVPTGNFGDVYAGYLARGMGLPMGTLLIATNRNDILARCLATGEYRMAGVAPTHSPSMDIEIASNFERLLFDLHDRDGLHLAQRMTEFRATRTLTLSPSQRADFSAIFSAHAVNDDETLATIARIYAETGYLLDPHTAVGVAAVEALQGGHNKLSCPQDGIAQKANGGTINYRAPNAPPNALFVTLATAHPAKFPEAVHLATGLTPPLPAHMADLYERTERLTPIARDSEAVKRYITAL